MSYEATQAQESNAADVIAGLLQDVVTLNAREDTLDDLVHTVAEQAVSRDGGSTDAAYDEASKEASNVNNGGFEDQLKYLLGNGVAADTIRQALQEAPDE